MKPFFIAVMAFNFAMLIIAASAYCERQAMAESLDTQELTVVAYLPIVTKAESTPTPTPIPPPTQTPVPEPTLPVLYYPCGIEPPDWFRLSHLYITSQYEDWWVGEAYCIAWFESAKVCGWEGVYDCVSPTGDYCLMQINRKSHEITVVATYGYWLAINIPEVCWAQARRIYESRNSWGAWSTRYDAGVG